MGLAATGPRRQGSPTLVSFFSPPPSPGAGARKMCSVLAPYVLRRATKVSRLNLFLLSFCLNVCPSELLEGLRRSLYPSICTVGSNSEVNNSLYKGGKCSRTISGYIALNAMSFSVCRPHRALKVDTLHISCEGRGETDEGSVKGLAIIFQGGGLQGRSHKSF